MQGKLQNVLIQFGAEKAQMDFIVLPNIPFDIVIGRYTLKRLEGELDFKRKVVRFEYRKRIETLPMVPEYARSRKVGGGTDSEYFTSDSDVESHSSEDKEEE